MKKLLCPPQFTVCMSIGIDLADRSQGRTEGFFFSKASTPRCRGGRNSFLRIAPLTLDPYLILLSVTQGGIKYHFFSLWYESIWNWILDIMPIDRLYIYIYIFTNLLCTSIHGYQPGNKQVTRSKVWTIGKVKNCLGQIVCGKDGVVDWCIVLLEMPLTRFEECWPLP